MNYWEIAAHTPTRTYIVCTLLCPSQTAGSIKLFYVRLCLLWMQSTSQRRKHAKETVTAQRSWWAIVEAFRMCRIVSWVNWHRMHQPSSTVMVFCVETMNRIHRFISFFLFSKTFNWMPRQIYVIILNLYIVLSLFIRLKKERKKRRKSRKCLNNNCITENSFLVVVTLRTVIGISATHKNCHCQLTEMAIKKYFWSSIRSQNLLVSHKKCRPILPSGWTKNCVNWTRTRVFLVRT